MKTDEAGNEDDLTDRACDTNVTDTSSYWPRNRESTSSAKATDLDSLFPFEKERR